MRICTACGANYRHRSDVVGAAVVGVIFAVVAAATGLFFGCLSVVALSRGGVEVLVTVPLLAMAVMCCVACFALLRSTIRDLRGRGGEDMRGFAVVNPSADPPADPADTVIPSADVWKK